MVGFYYQNTETANTMNIGRYYVAEWGAALGIGVSNLALIRPMEIDDTTKSIFATRTFYLSEKLHLTAGVRHTDVDKDYIRITSGLGINGASEDLLFDDFNIKYTHKGSLADGTLQENAYSESATTPSLMVQYFKDENSMLYVSYSDGFKAGGYEALGTALANNGAYNSEGVDAYEIGYKTSNDKMKMSMNYFNSKYDGNQLSQFIYPEDGAPYNTTSNVPSTNKGIELELSYLLSDSIIADLSFTKLDATYDDYTGGTCALGATPVAGTSGCDYTGLPLLYAADNSGLFH
jgi:outer membrane receptor protein involved in Fe transport